MNLFSHQSSNETAEVYIQEELIEISNDEMSITTFKGCDELIELSNRC